jgi:hypothetical protein
MHKPFSHPVLVRGKLDNLRSIASADQAADFLMSEWPAERDEWHRDAVDACLKVLEGYRSTVDAEHAFREAAERAGIMASSKDGGAAS